MALDTDAADVIVLLVLFIMLFAFVELLLWFGDGIVECAADLFMIRLDDESEVSDDAAPPLFILSDEADDNDEDSDEEDDAVFANW